MSDKQRFQEILTGIRSDLKYLKQSLLGTLRRKIQDNSYYIDEDLKYWILDTFLDKFFEIDAKIAKIYKDFGISKSESNAIDIKISAEKIANKGRGFPPEVDGDLHGLYLAIKTYEEEIESAIGAIRVAMHRTDWNRMKKMKPAEYVLPVKRAKFVRARDELEKAKQAVKEKKWDEVLNHLRPAIDLAIKEKFGFRKIQPMKEFLSDAERCNLPLPSYALVYDIFDEGSQRIHGGKLHTPWECEKALSFVADFIDRLDLVSISQEDINEFKRKSKAVS